MKSLRIRLMLTLLAGLAVIGALGAAGIFWRSIEELNEQFDQYLQSICLNLPPDSLMHNPRIDDIEEKDDIVVQLWSRDGELLFHSVEEELAPPPAGAGFTTGHNTNGTWRSYARRTSEGGFLQVAQELSERQEMAAAMAFQLLLPLLVALPLLGFFTLWAVARQLRPLQILADQLVTRDAMSPSAVHLEHAPIELAPVLAALNDLLARQAEAAGKQRAFLADVAHALRTPLAVVSLQTQRAQRSTSDGERGEALAALKGGVERATRMVSQLLDMARSEREITEAADPAALQFDLLLKAVLAELHPLAVDKGVDLGLVQSCACTVSGDAETLRSAIVNLVDNAIRYSPTGGRVDVALRAERGLAILTVSDTGPGIAPALRGRVFERFSRAGSPSGTGLGLAIVHRVILRHGGGVALEDGIDGRGLTVRVTLPVTS